ncbi:MAG: hypothetical protein JWM20_347 [Patescibacteria group bacterium]|nr:hypothetical protein [Patescibacteria group bacterium]
MQKNTWISIVIVAIAIIAIVLVFVFGSRPATAPLNNGGATADQTGAQNSGNTAGGTLSGSNVLNITPSNSLVDYKSDLITFSIVPGSRILSLIQGTGTIDPTYVENGEIRIQLADENYSTTKVITGSVIGTDSKGNIKFVATFDTSGIKKGAGNIIFKQVSGNHTVHIPIVFD